MTTYHHTLIVISAFRVDHVTATRSKYFAQKHFCLSSAAGHGSILDFSYAVCTNSLPRKIVSFNQY